MGALGSLGQCLIILQNVPGPRNMGKGGRNTAWLILFEFSGEDGQGRGQLLALERGKAEEAATRMISYAVYPPPPAENAEFQKEFSLCSCARPPGQFVNGKDWQVLTAAQGQWRKLGSREHLGSLLSRDVALGTLYLKIHHGKVYLSHNRNAN